MMTNNSGMGNPIFQLFNMTEERYLEMQAIIYGLILVNCMCPKCGNHLIVEKVLEYFIYRTKISKEFNPDEKRFIFYVLGRSMDEDYFWELLGHEMDKFMGEEYVIQKIHTF